MLGMSDPQVLGIAGQQELPEGFRSNELPSPDISVFLEIPVFGNKETAISTLCIRQRHLPFLVEVHSKCRLEDGIVLLIRM